MREALRINTKRKGPQHPEVVEEMKGLVALLNAQVNAA